MDYMRELPDKFADLAICDPPYGLHEASKRIHSRHHSQMKYKPKSWDSATPDKTYFDELFRVSKNQIIWGANHFGNMPPSSCWIVWDKDGFGDQADCELAWTSFPTAVRKYKFTWNGFRKEMPCDRIHPTEKPVSLYKWLLKNYAKEGDRILDSHMGSQSSRIAAFDMGFDFTGYELDKDYFEAGNKRFEQHKAQLKLFV